jgi:hypothetical protein
MSLTMQLIPAHTPRRFVCESQFVYGHIVLPVCLHLLPMHPIIQNKRTYSEERRMDLQEMY